MGRVDKKGVWHCTIPGEIISVSSGSVCGCLHPCGHFTDEELEIIYHAAAHAFGDANMFDEMATQLDISDELLVMLREKLFKYLVS
jgi:hypothetical protein